MTISKKFMGGLSVAVLATSSLTFTLPAKADDAGAFVGGMLTSRVLGNMHARTQAEQQQAYYAQQQAQAAQQQQQAAPPPQAAPAQKTTEQKLEELNSLAANGYITPEEYKAQKQKILNEM